MARQNHSVSPPMIAFRPSTQDMYGRLKTIADNNNISLTKVVEALVDKALEDLGTDAIIRAKFILVDKKEN